MALAQRLTAGNQRRIVLNTRQLLPFTQQASTQVPLAGTPVEPMRRLRGKRQTTGKRFNLQPLAPRHIDIQAMARSFQRMPGQLTDSAQLSRYRRQ